MQRFEGLAQAQCGYLPWMRIPGALSGVPMNSMPAASSVAFSAIMELFLAPSGLSSFSMLWTVLKDNPHCEANLAADQPNAALPALI